MTVRTLHLYDRMGLLPPAQRSESGYRLYGQRELERLEQIVALRFIGFRLQEIKELLSAKALPLIVALRMQREIIRERRAQLDRAIDAIERAKAVMGDVDESALWGELRAIIKAMRVENSDWAWTKNYYTDEAKQKIDERAATFSKEQIEARQRAWTQLIAEVEAAAKVEDPVGKHAQELAKRWKALVHEFTRGDASIQSGLNKLWSDPTHWPKDFKRPWSDEADRSIRAAMNCEALK